MHSYYDNNLDTDSDKSPRQRQESKKTELAAETSIIYESIIQLTRFLHPTYGTIFYIISGQSVYHEYYKFCLAKATSTNC